MGEDAQDEGVRRRVQICQRQMMLVCLQVAYADEVAHQLAQFGRHAQPLDLTYEIR
jgi:hypothetical protein